MAHAGSLALDHSYTDHTQTAKAGLDLDHEDHLFQWHTLDLWHWIIPIHITNRQPEQGRIDPEDHLFQWYTLDLWHWIIPIHITDSQSRAGS